MKQIEELLKETIGLDASSVGSALIHRAARVRMRTIGLRRLEEYEAMIRNSRAEWEEFVESVLVAETWFFRDAEQFAFVVRLAMEQWLPSHRTVPFRVLSVPCASGEEPYSLVMALRSAGLPTERIRIDAADVSVRALQRADRGIYRKNSFRGQDLDFRERYFQTTREGFILNPAIRGCVQFHADNLLSDDFLHGKAGYDCVFCRNLLIYFDPATQRKALEKIERLLVPSGVLIVGPAEQPIVIDHGFVSLKAPKACAFLKPGTPAPPRTARPTRTHAAAKAAARPAPEAKPEPEAARPAPASTTEATGLETARRFADAGRLEEAARICQAHLDRHYDCAEAHYLLGLVRDASGEAGAIDCYRKALYLEPNHYESLLQMALLAQKDGNLDRARNLRNRAQRAKPNGEP